MSEHNLMIFVQKSRLLSLLLIVVMGSWLLASPLYAQEDEATAVPSGLTMTAVAGYDGFYKLEHGVPVIINIANNGAPLEGHLQISVGGFNNQTIYKSPISLPTQSQKRVPLYIHLSGNPSQLTIQLRDNNDNLIYEVDTNLLNQMRHDSVLYGVVSPDAGKYSLLENVTGTRTQAEVAFLDLTHLPDVAPVWNALDVLVLDEVDTAELTPAQLEALLGWVHTGGQLVVTGGPGWQKSTAGTAHLLPVTPTGNQSVADLPALTAQTGEPFRDAGPYIITQSSLNGGGELLYHQDGLPILARQKAGRGAVYFLALDPKLAPLRDWDGSPLLWEEVVRQLPDTSTWYVRNAYSAATAVSSLPSLALPSTLQLLLFLFVYVIMVGPINYFVLKRRRRLERSWITIPLIVIFFTVLAYFTGFQLKGNDIIINQMSIAQGEVGSDYMRVQTPIGVYSPKRASYDIQFEYNNLARPFDRGTSPLGGSGNIAAIMRGSQLTLNEARLDISDVATFIADTYQPMPAITAQATMRVEGQDILFEVLIQNNSDFDLENGVVFLSQTPFEVGAIAAGTEQSLSEIVGTVSSGLTSSTPYYSGSGQPLLDNAALLLGTTNYYDDREAYPRWELLQALQGDYYGGGATTLPRFGVDAVTLVAWADQSQLNITLTADNVQNRALTLYLLEIPLVQNVYGGDEELTIPASLLHWEVLGTNGVYNPSPFGFYMAEGWVEFEFQPWAEFQEIEADSMTLVVKPQYDPGMTLPPAILLWNWRTSQWDRVADVSWGEMVLSEVGNYVSTTAAVRIRLEKSDLMGIEIDEIYPLLTGKLK